MSSLSPPKIYVYFKITIGSITHLMVIDVATSILGGVLPNVM
jgi:hypothetical protein